MTDDTEVNKKNRRGTREGVPFCVSGEGYAEGGKFLEKIRAHGCFVEYIQKNWLFFYKGVT